MPDVSKKAPARNLHTSCHGILLNMFHSCLEPAERTVVMRFFGQRLRSLVTPGFRHIHSPRPRHRVSTCSPNEAVSCGPPPQGDLNCEKPTRLARWLMAPLLLLP